MPLQVNLENLLDVLQKVTDLDDLCLHLGVPKHELNKIRQYCRTTDEQKWKMLQWWLNNDIVEWEVVITALRAMNKPVLADAVEVVIKEDSLHEPPNEESQKSDKNIRIIKLIDEKLREVLQRSQHLGKEWEKGEKEWREFLKEMKKIEEVWEKLIKSQQTERAFLTLGISLLDYSDLEPLHQTDALSEKAETIIATSRKLRELYRRATQHRSKLQNTETELEEWEKALLEHASKLQRYISCMGELEEKFLGETKDCRKQLEKSREQLQTCRRKMSECRDELTKSQRQLQRCQDKLIECGEYFKRCRDELSNSQSQITHCIEGVKRQSEDLSDQIQRLTLRASRVGAAGGASTGAAIGSVFGGPFGATAGLFLGGYIGQWVGEARGGAMARAREKDLEETRKNLSDCKDELNDCSNVVKSCGGVLGKSEQELEEVQKIVIELDQFLYH